MLSQTTLDLITFGIPNTFSLCQYKPNRKMLYVNFQSSILGSMNPPGAVGTNTGPFPLSLNYYQHRELVGQQWTLKVIQDANPRDVWFYCPSNTTMKANSFATPVPAGIFAYSNGTSAADTWMITVWESDGKDDGEVQQCVGVIDQITGKISYPDSCRKQTRKPELYAQVASMLDRAASQEIGKERRNPWIFNTAFLLNGSSVSNADQQDTSDSPAV